MKLILRRGFRGGTLYIRPLIKYIYIYIFCGEKREEKWLCTQQETRMEYTTLIRTLLRSRRNFKFDHENDLSSINAEKIYEFFYEINNLHESIKIKS